MSERLLTVYEVADRLGIRPGTVRLHIWKRTLTFVRIGRAIRVREVDVEEFVRRNLIPANAEATTQSRQGAGTR